MLKLRNYCVLIETATELVVTLAGIEDLEIDLSYFQHKADMMQSRIKRTEEMWSVGPCDSCGMSVYGMRNGRTTGSSITNKFPQR
jgi:hypothetical protein